MVIANTIYEGEIRLGKRLAHNDRQRARKELANLFVDQRTKRPRKRWYNKAKRKIKLDQYIRDHADELKVYYKAYREEHREEIRTYQAAYRKKPRNAERRRMKMRAYYEANKAFFLAAGRKSYALHKKRLCERTSARKKSDPCFKLKCAMRGRVYDVLKRGSKSARTMELVGCSAEDLKSHLERQFTPGMSWDNYGPYWEVHHIIACSEFSNLSDPIQQRECFHYTNLRPLDRHTNRSMGAQSQARKTN